MAFLKWIANLVLIVFSANLALAFNYMDYTNLYDGIAHVQRLKIMGKSTWTSHDSVWRAWEFLGIRYATADRFQVMEN